MEERNRKKSYIKNIIILIVLAGAVGAGVFYLCGGFDDLNDPKVIASRVSKHILVDTDEDPNISTVENASELSAQPFFKNVKDGDKILIYASAARIIIYRPSENRLINVGPIIDDSASDSDSTTTPTDDSAGKTPAED